MSVRARSGGVFVHTTKCSLVTSLHDAVALSGCCAVVGEDPPHALATQTKGARLHNGDGDTA
jgi:hypothetical protein